MRESAASFPAEEWISSNWRKINHRVMTERTNGRVRKKPWSTAKGKRLLYLTALRSGRDWRRRRGRRRVRVWKVEERRVGIRRGRRSARKVLKAVGVQMGMRVMAAVNHRVQGHCVFCSFSLSKLFLLWRRWSSFSAAFAHVVFVVFEAVR